MFPSVATGTNSRKIKQHNVSAVLLTLLHHENVSRVYLAEHLGVSGATISNLVTELAGQGFIVEEGHVPVEDPGAGRPRRALRLVSDARYAAGIHIDIGIINLALTGITGHIYAQVSFEYDVRTSWQRVMDRVVVQLHRLMDEQHITASSLVGVGVAASGLVDYERGINIFAPNLNWKNAPLGDYLEQRLNIPVMIENNVRAMALGESLFGIATDVSAMAFIYARIGMGAGLVINGQLYRGSHMGAGEIGHTAFLLDEGGVHTLESLVSERALRRAGNDTDDVFALAASGDSAARDLLSKQAFYTGLALANLVNIFNPELIVMGGIFAQAKDIFLPTIRETMAQYAFAAPGEEIRLELSPAGNTAGMIGAAALVLDRYFYRQTDLL